MLWGWLVFSYLTWLFPSLFDVVVLKHLCWEAGQEVALPVHYSSPNWGLALRVIGVQGLKALWQFGKEVCSPQTSKNPHGGFAVCSHRASCGFTPPSWFSYACVQGRVDGGKGDARGVLRKEMSYCFSLDRWVERLKHNSNDYWHSLNTLFLHHINLEDLSVICRLGIHQYSFEPLKTNTIFGLRELLGYIIPYGIYWNNTLYSAVGESLP